MAKKTSGVTVITPPFRVSYPKVFKPEYNKLSKRDEYSLVALFPIGEKLEELKKAAYKVCCDTWGDNPKKWPKKLKTPFKDQGEREKELEDGTKQMPEGYVKGALMINMKSKNQPGLIDQKKKPILDPDKFYAGCWARAEVYVQTFDIEDGMSVGVSVSLNHLQLVKDDEPLSGRRKAEDAFTAIEDDEDSVAAFAAADDDDEDSNPFA